MRQLTEIEVAPLVGAWIEICVWLPFKVPAVSLPLWERGLKYEMNLDWILEQVAPLVGAWIEILI